MLIQARVGRRVRSPADDRVRLPAGTQGAGLRRCARRHGRRRRQQVFPLLRLRHNRVNIKLTLTPANFDANPHASGCRLQASGLRKGASASHQNAIGASALLCSQPSGSVHGTSRNAASSSTPLSIACATFAFAPAAVSHHWALLSFQTPSPTPAALRGVAPMNSLKLSSHCSLLAPLSARAAEAGREQTAEVHGKEAAYRSTSSADGRPPAPASCTASGLATSSRRPR